jgi:hypothetical protein
MASFDFKTEAPEAAISDSNLLFGATSYAAEFPSVFPVSTLRTLLIGGGTLAITAGKTLTVTETMTLTALGAGQTFTFPAASGTVALLNAANLFTTANTFSPLTDVAALTARRYGVGATANILQLQDESNNVLAAFDASGYLSLGRASGVTGQLKLLNSTNANTVTLQPGVTSSSWALTLPTTAGTNNYVLTTNGSGVSSWAQVSLTAGVTGTLPVGNGGTGQTTLTIHGVLIGNAAGAISTTSAGTAGQFLVSQGASADPTWTTATFPTTAGPVGTILRSDGTNWVATTATYPATTTAGTLIVSASANTITSSATPTLGVAGTAAGTISLSGVTSGVVTLQTANAAGTWSLTLPTSGGTSGYLLQTDGTGISSWFNLFGTANTWTANQSFSAQVLLKDGTAASPSLAFSNYTGTGIYSYGANAIGFSINGSYAAQFDASSHLLIGTADDGASGANILTLAAAADAGMTIRSGSTNTGNLYFSRATVGANEYAGYVQYNHTSDYMVFGVGAAEKMRLTSAAALTIGVQQTTQGSLVLANTGAGAYATTIQSSNSSTAAWTLTLPTDVPGANGYLLASTTGGISSWFNLFGTANTFTASQTFNAATSSIYLGANGGNLGIATFYGSTSGSVTLKAAAAAGTTSFTLPVGNGSNGYILTTDGSGVTNWTDPTALGIDLNIGVTPTVGGASGQIMFDTGSVIQEDSGLIYSSANKTITLNGNLILGAPVSATMRLGAADAASPVAQSLTVQNVATGTADTAGVNFTIKGSAGTGTGAGGSIIFQTAPAGASSSAQNAFATVLTIDSVKASTFTGDVVAPAGTTSMTSGFMYIAAAAGAPAGTPTGQTGRVPLYYDTTNNYLYVYNGSWKRVSFADNFLTQE